MTKKKLSIAGVGDIRKPEREEPKPEAPKRGRAGRPAERTPYVQLNSRVKLETSEQIDAIMDREGCTLREVIERAVANFYNK